MTTTRYSLIWVTPLGYAGSDQGVTYASIADAQSHATPDITWSREGDGMRSTVDSYGDRYFIKAVR